MKEKNTRREKDVTTSKKTQKIKYILVILLIIMIAIISVNFYNERSNMETINNKLYEYDLADRTEELDPEDTGALTGTKVISKDGKLYVKGDYNVITQDNVVTLQVLKSRDVNVDEDTYVDVVVGKRWNVPSNLVENYRVKIRLIASVNGNETIVSDENNKEIVKTLTGNEQVSFRNLRAYEDDTEIEYKAQEIEIEKKSENGEWKTVPLDMFKIAQVKMETTEENEEEDEEEEDITINYGKQVNYTTTLNGQTLDNWEVFYVEGDYTYIILSDYLPNAAVDTDNINGLSTYSNYSVYTQNDRTDLIDAMLTESNWDSLLTGTLNGHTVNETRSENVWAMGAPTLDLWVKSWNVTSQSDALYTSYSADVNNNGYDGWYIGDSENPSSAVIDLSNKTGYNDTLYFPHQDSIDNNECFGYWLASPSANDPDCVMQVGYDGYVSNFYRDYYYYAFRPIIRLPSTIVNQ